MSDVYQRYGKVGFNRELEYFGRYRDVECDECIEFKRKFVDASIVEEYDAGLCYCFVDGIALRSSIHTDIADAFLDSTDELE